MNGLQVFNSSAVKTFDSSESPGGVIARVVTQPAAGAGNAVWSFPAFAGRTGLAYPLGIDPTKVAVDHALGYPRFVVQQASSGPGGAPAALLVS